MCMFTGKMRSMVRSGYFDTDSYAFKVTNGTKANKNQESTAILGGSVRILQQCFELNAWQHAHNYTMLMFTR